MSDDERASGHAKRRAVSLYSRRLRFTHIQISSDQGRAVQSRSETADDDEADVSVAKTL